jgi:hypothetical protein
MVARLDLRLTLSQRQALSNLARESGLSCSDVARLAIRNVIAHPEVIAALRPEVEQLRETADVI